MSTPLYQLTGALLDLQQNTDTDCQVAVRDTLDAIEGEFNQKAVAVSHIILNLDSDSEAIDAEIKRLTERKRAIENRRDDVREYLRSNMEAAGITKISCPLFSITLAQGREVVVIDDEDSLPDELVNVTTKVAPDKAAIAAAIKAGQEVPGARLERSKSSIRIK